MPQGCIAVARLWQRNAAWQCVCEASPGQHLPSVYPPGTRLLALLTLEIVMGNRWVNTWLPWPVPVKTPTWMTKGAGFRGYKHGYPRVQRVQNTLMGICQRFSRCRSSIGGTCVTSLEHEKFDIQLQVVMHWHINEHYWTHSNALAMLEHVQKVRYGQHGWVTAKMRFLTTGLGA
jgi:hypothetical protein